MVIAHSNTMSEAMQKHSRIYVAGHRGLVGSALIRALQAQGYINLITRTHAELDLTNQSAVQEFFEQEKPAYVILAAAKVGGILANSTYPAEFIRENLAIQTNVIHESWRAGVKRLLFLGSSCIYPRDCPQPIKEEYLLTGPLEPTNSAYAIAKIAGISMCAAYNRQYGTQYLAVMPTNLYGPGDNFDLKDSHVIPAMIRKFHEAKQQGNKEVTIWGSGSPRREFLFSDDLADACRFLFQMAREDFDALLAAEPPIVNVGSDQELTIKELAELVSNTLGLECNFVWDGTKPDGTPRKLLSGQKLAALGWRPKTLLADGIKHTYDVFVRQS